MKETGIQPYWDWFGELPPPGRPDQPGRCWERRPSDNPQPAPAEQWQPTTHGTVNPAAYERAWEARWQREQSAQERNRQAWVPQRAPAEDRWPKWLQALIFWGGLAVIAGVITLSLLTGWFKFGILSAALLRVVLKFS